MPTYIHANVDVAVLHGDSGPLNPILAVELQYTEEGRRSVAGGKHCLRQACYYLPTAVFLWMVHEDCQLITADKCQHRRSSYDEHKAPG